MIGAYLMPLATPELVTPMFWTARIAAVLYASGVGLLLVGWRGPANSVARGIYTAGCCLLWVHVGLAFHVAHGWSHADAVRQTGVRTPS
jgi:hypothetical protein